MVYKVKPLQKEKIRKVEVFELKPKLFPPHENSILEVLDKSKIALTPTKIAKLTRMHPTTAKAKIEDLQKEGIVMCEQAGKRMYCRINKEKYIPI